MRLGSHLPQYGRLAGPDAVARAARHAEELGYADVWVSDHVVHPAAQSYPSPSLLEPFLTLAWAAAATTTIGLGTSVAVLPHHSPLHLANTVASLDVLSGGRVTLGVGVGWSEAEFAALGMSFHDRGARTDEIIDLLRTVWRDDPATFRGAHHSFTDVRVLPQPAHEIPIWVGGSGPRAHRRGVEKGDGFQLIGVTPAEAAPAIERLRAGRPDESFTISLRTGWDPQGMAPDDIRREHEAFAAAGVQHVVSAPWQKDLDSWLRSMELLAGIVLGR